MDDTPVAGAAPRPHMQGNSASPRLVIIAAASRNGVIGQDNRMPWHLPADLLHFRALTEGHSVIMGRRTFESMGRPLPKRQNIVITRNPALTLPGCTMAGSLADALARCTLPEPVFCIGGAEIYRLALPFADEIRLTEIDADVSGDTLLPAISPAAWREAQRDAAVDPKSGMRYSFVHLLRIDQPPVSAMPQTVGIDPT